MAGLIDIGANLTHESFAHDFDPMLDRARASGVRHIMVTGTTVAGSRQAERLVQHYPGILSATAGVHPHHASQWDANSAAVLRALLASPGVVAVGECGLDFFRNYSPPADQYRAFEDQLALAGECGKPLFLHQRAAHQEFLEMVSSAITDLPGGVAHCFTAGRAELEAYLELGLYIGITGWICDERRGASLREAVRHLPLDRVLLETDAPYLRPRDAPALADARRNEPALLPHIAARTARHMQVDIQELISASTHNAMILFNIKSPTSARI